MRVWHTLGTSPLEALLPSVSGWESTPWEGTLDVGETLMVTVPLRAWTWKLPVRVDAILEDNAGQRWERRLWLNVEPWQCYLPVIYKQR
jgi:hypothetical protein